VTRLQELRLPFVVVQRPDTEPVGAVVVGRRDAAPVEVLGPEG